MTSKAIRPETNINTLMGRRLKQLREDAAISENTLAKALNISVENYRRFEVGAEQFYPASLIALSQAIDCPIAYFYSNLTAGDDYKFPDLNETAELLYYFAGVASPLARRKIIAGARQASLAPSIPAAFLE